MAVRHPQHRRSLWRRIVGLGLIFVPLSLVAQEVQSPPLPVMGRGSGGGAFTYVSAEPLPADSLTRYRQYTTMVGAGFGNVLDTYLSPYSYTGINIRFHHEYARWTRIASHPISQGEEASPPVPQLPSGSPQSGGESGEGGANGDALPEDPNTATVDSIPLVTPSPWERGKGGEACVSYHTYIALDGNILDNPAGNINEYSGGLRCSMAWKYHFRPVLGGKLHLSVGPMATLYAGGIYNEHDGNNPAQGRVSLTIDATATAAMPIRMLHRNCLLSLSADVPLIGLAFSPNYGQSYYELFSLGNYDHNIVLAHTGNMPSLRTQLLLHIPLNARATTALRIGYVGEMMQSTFNNLRYHQYSHTLMLGLSKTLYRL